MLNTQRDKVYLERRRALLSRDLSPLITEYAERTVDDILEVCPLLFTTGTSCFPEQSHRSGCRKTHAQIKLSSNCHCGVFKVMFVSCRQM